MLINAARYVLAMHKESLLRSACSATPFLVALALAMGCGTAGTDDTAELRAEVTRLRIALEAERTARAAAEARAEATTAEATPEVPDEHGAEPDESGATDVCAVQAAFDANAVAAGREYPEYARRRVTAVVARVHANAVSAGGWIEPQGCPRATLETDSGDALAALRPGQRVVATCRLFGWYRGGITWDGCTLSHPAAVEVPGDSPSVETGTP